jgi:hypothetical protein
MLNLYYKQRRVDENRGPGGGAKRGPPPRPRTLDLRRRRQPGGVIPGDHKKEK